MNIECSSADKKTENRTTASPERISQDGTKNWGSFSDKESNQQGRGSVPIGAPCKSRDLPVVSARARNPVDRPLIPPKPHVLHSGACGTEAKQPSQPLHSQLQSREGFHGKREMTGNTKHKPPKPNKPQAPPRPQHICTSGVHTITTITLEKEKNEKTATRSYVKWQIQFFEEKQRSFNEPSKRNTKLPPSEAKQSPMPQHRSHAHTETTTTLEREYSEKTPYIGQQRQFYEGRQKEVSQSPGPSKKSLHPAEIKQSPMPQHRSHAHTETATTLEREHSEKTPSPEPSEKSFHPAEVEQSPTPQHRSHAHTETATTLREYSEKTLYISQQRQLYEGRQRPVAQSSEPSKKSFHPAEVEQSPMPQHSSHAHTETATTLEREYSEKTPYISQQRRFYEGRQKEVPRSPGPSRRSFKPAEIKQSTRPQHRLVRVHIPPQPIGSERRRFTFNSSSQPLLDRARQLSSNRKWCDQPEVCVLELWPPAYNMHTEKTTYLKVTSQSG